MTNSIEMALRKDSADTVLSARTQQQRKRIGRRDHLTRLFGLALAGFFVTGIVTWAQDTEDGSNAEAREAAKKRIEALSASALVNGSSSMLKFSNDPIQVFSDPTRKESAGTVWAIGTEGRPKAVLSLFTITGEEHWNYEFTSMTNEPLTVGKAPKWAWKPTKSDVTSREFKSDHAVANTPAARLSQMKAITRDFTAAEVYQNGTRTELRLLARPLVRYTDEGLGIIDGALFSFANGTNPEILLLVEAVKGNGGQLTWQYGACRMSTAELHLMLKDAEVWKAERTVRNSANDPYFSHREVPPPRGFQ